MYDVDDDNRYNIMSSKMLILLLGEHFKSMVIKNKLNFYRQKLVLRKYFRIFQLKLPILQVTFYSLIPKIPTR